jgi:protein transport protein SEC24
LLESNGLSTVSGDLLASLNEAVNNAAEASGAKDALSVGLGGASHSGTGSNTPNPSGPSSGKGGNKKKPTSSSDDENIRRPVPIARVFAIDVSWSAVKGGVVREVCQGIKEALYGKGKEQALDSNGEDEGGEQEEDAWRVPEGRVGIVTFDRAVQFYNLSVSPGRPCMT